MSTSIRYPVNIIDEAAKLLGSKSRWVRAVIEQKDNPYAELISAASDFDEAWDICSEIPSGNELKHEALTKVLDFANKPEQVILVVAYANDGSFVEKKALIKLLDMLLAKTA